MREIAVGSRTALADGTRILIDVDGVEVGVFEHRAQLYAFENRCMHQGGPVCEGLLLGRVRPILDAEGRERGNRFDEQDPHLVCPWHGWEYELSTGRSVAYENIRLRAFEVVDRDGEVYVVA